MTLRRSPDRNTFQRQSYLERKLEECRTPDNDDDIKAMIDYFDRTDEIQLEREEDPEWKKNNLEYDLRTSDVIAEKCKDAIYAQHLYAALCNNEFTKNDIWPLLKEERWSCSWRYAGGIIAHIREEGDYIDWYCSGMVHGLDNYTQEEIDLMSEDQRQIHKEALAHVPESVVTDEIRKDLLDLGWIVAESTDD